MTVYGFLQDSSRAPYGSWIYGWWTADGVPIQAIMQQGQPSALDLNFLSGTLDPRITFSRTSLATMVDANGFITYGPNNQIRFSEDMTGANWGALASTKTINSIVENTTASAQHGVNQTLAVQGGVNYIAAFDLQSSGRNYATLYMDDGTNILAKVTFDLTTGQATASSAKQGLAYGAVPASGGGWRCYVVGQAIVSGTGKVQLNLGTNGTDMQAYTGDGVSAILVTRVQMEAVTYETAPRSYNATLATAYYGPRYETNGLLREEASTNIILQSSNLGAAPWSAYTQGAAVPAIATPNYALGPDGTMSATRVQFDCTDASSGSNRSGRIQTTPTVSGTTYAVSVWAKATTPAHVGEIVHIGYNAVGNFYITLTANWTRTIFPASVCGVTNSQIILETIGTLTGQTADMLIYGLQAEAQPYATSTMPSGATAFVRAADNAKISGPNFSSWFNPVQGTFVCEFDVLGLGGTSATPYSVNDAAGAKTSWIRHYLNSAGNIFYNVRDAGADQCNINPGGAITANTINKVAIAYQANNFAASRNGSAPGTDLAGTIPTVLEEMTIGGDAAQILPFNGHIRRITYYNQWLPVQTLST